MPHLLIAGTPGSGKSVCMNSIIISLLYKAAPEDVKLIMVDPKMVELGIYNGIPHLLIPVVTDPKKAAGSLSLLYKAAPEDVKLIMVDPKMVELGIYNGIPHLLIPVVTDPKKAAGSLQWAVTEMLRRYKLMSDAGVRDLELQRHSPPADSRGHRPQEGRRKPAMGGDGDAAAG